MKQSLYIYNNGDLKRKDNTLQFTTYEGDKRDIPIERISDIYILSEMSFNTAFITTFHSTESHYISLTITTSIQEATIQKKAYLPDNFS